MNKDNDQEMQRVQLNISHKMLNHLKKRLYPIGIFSTGDCIRHVISTYLQAERDKDIQ